MKRTVALFLVACMSLTTILLSLSGCGVTASADNGITNGELIVMVNEAFHFSGYSSDEPYYSSISADNTFFGAVQTAREFNVIDDLVTDFKASDTVTREFCAMILSGAVNKDKTYSVNISDSKEITYIDDVLTVLNYGLMELDEGNRFKPREAMGYTECRVLVDEAVEIWATNTVDTPKYSISLDEDVIDLAGLDCYSIDESTGEMSFDSSAYADTRSLMTENHFRYNPASGEITVDSVEALGISEKSVLVVPLGSNGTAAVEAETIVENPDGTFTVKTAAVNGERIIENYTYEQRVVPDFSKAVFKDTNGNVVSADSVEENEALLSSAFSSGKDTVFDDGIAKFDRGKNDVYSNLASHNSGSRSFNGVSHTFNTEIGKVTLSAGSGYIKASVSTVLAKNDDGNCTLSYGYGFENITFDTDVDVHIIGNKHVKFVMNYTTAEKLGIKGNYSKSVPVGTVSVPIDPAGVFSAELDVSIAVSFEGEINVTLSTSGRAAGFEWRGGKGISIINKAGTKALDVSGDAKLEVTVPVDLSVTALWGVLEAGVILTPGVGAKAKIETTQIPEGDGDPTPLICTQVDVYPIYRTTIYATIHFLGDHTKDATMELLGEKDIAFSVHLEMFGAELPKVVPECTKDQRLKQLKDDDTKAAGVLVGDTLKISAYKEEIDLSKTLTINITMVPSGYSYEDIMVCCRTKDSPIEIVGGKSMLGISFMKMTSFSQDIIGIAEGKTTISFKTSDNKYCADCSVAVVDSTKSRDYSIKLSTYGKAVSLGTVGTIKIESVPDTITEDDVLWSSDNTDAVMVDQYGKVTAIGEGYAIVTASTPDGRSTAACALTVNAISGNLSVMIVPDFALEMAEFEL